MKLPLIVLLLVAGTPALPTPAAAPTPVTAKAPWHCQVPCGIFSDQMRVQMLMEDCDTIEKAMAQIAELEKAANTNYNQIVRWVTTKDEHAQKIQQQCLDYWLAQRIKAPAPGADEAAVNTYLHQLASMHGMIVSAMKCKQSLDASHVSAIRERLKAFSETYFSAEDHEHLHGEHAGEHRGK